METVKDVDRYVDTFEFEEGIDGSVKTGFIVKVIRLQKTLKSAAEVITTLYQKPVNEPALLAKLRRVSIQFKKVRGGNLKNDSIKKAVHNFLNDSFVVPVPVPPATFPPQPSSSTPVSDSVSSLPAATAHPPSPHSTDSLPVPLAPPSPHPPSLNPLAPLLPPAPRSTVTPVASSTLRGDCNRCLETRSAGAAALSSVKKKLCATRAACSSVKRDYKVKTVNRFKKRKREQLDKKKEKVKEQAHIIDNLTKEVEELGRRCKDQEKEITDLRRQVRSLETKTAKDNDYQKHIKFLEKKVFSLEKDLDQATNQSDSSHSDIESKS